MTSDNAAQKIPKLLRRLGVAENYTGFPYAVSTRSSSPSATPAASG